MKKYELGKEYVICRKCEEYCQEINVENLVFWRNFKAHEAHCKNSRPYLVVDDEGGEKSAACRFCKAKIVRNITKKPQSVPRFHVKRHEEHCLENPDRSTLTDSCPCGFKSNKGCVDRFSSYKKHQKQCMTICFET